MNAAATLAGFMKKHGPALMVRGGVPPRMLRPYQAVVFEQHGVEPLFTR